MVSQYPNNLPVVSQWMWLSVSSNSIVSVLGSKSILWSSHWWTVFSLVTSVGNTVGLLLNSFTWFNFFPLIGFCICVLLGYSPGFHWKVYLFFLLVSHADSIFVWVFCLSWSHFGVWVMYWVHRLKLLRVFPFNRHPQMFLIFRSFSFVWNMLHYRYVLLLCFSGNHPWR